MLTCITCSKQKDDDGDEEGARGTPSTKESVKSLTSQIKDMALKMSGSYKQSKQHSPNIYKRGNRHYPEFDTISEGVPYPYAQQQQQQGGSSSSTPAWDFGSKSRFSRPFPSDDRTSSVVLESDLVLDEHDEPKEWMAQVEPGVQITFVSLPNGGNDLKRIRFSRESFDKWQAQRWWGENYDRIMELYNVQRFNRQALNTPGRSEDENRDSSYSRFGSVRDSPMTPSLQQKDMTRNYYKGEPSMDPSRTTTSSRDEPSVSASNASEVDSEWIEQDEPGVYITIRQLVDGTRELRRVRFSREMFGERNAKTWWEENRERIQAQYL
ncbi:protein BREVIS RADIX-like [Impatiens glandulifera]|uniref:protein BREVIS RADIX-like n=1 Tax=Impatiens glandulifera TaxID=253017 RepID=UPI001FB0C1C2|nr:protein BREVIS RADIX-like [Impatiens glandulifera]